MLSLNLSSTQCENKSCSASYVIYVYLCLLGIPANFELLDGFSLSANFWKETAFTRPILDMVSECRQHHPQCQGKGTPLLPTTVLDISTCTSDGTVRLHDSFNNERRDYVALSYCWGGPQKTVTTKANRNAHQQQGIAVAKLPRSIADAVLITAQLGIPYLWVDALCITQDDHEAKAREIENMGDVYSNATLVLFASGLSRAADDGILNYLDEVAVVPLLTRITPTGEDQGQACIVHVALSHTKNRIAPLDSRGWTFQERYLSSRRLECCGAAGISLTCIESTSRFACDAWTTTDANFEELFVDNHKKEGHGRDGVSTWHELISDYCFRHFTIKEDRLPAIAGLAKRHMALSSHLSSPSSKNGGVYLAGLWKNQIIDDLMWQATIVPENRLSLDQYRQPGWSWISVLDHRPGQIICGVSKQTKHQDLITTEASLVRHSMHLAHIDAPFGHVLDGTITLHAKIAPVSGSFLAAPRPFVVDETCTYHLTTEERERQLQLVWLQSGTMYSIRSERTRNYDRGLLVLPCDGRNGTWKRLGTFTNWADTVDEALVHWGGIEFQNVNLM